MALSLYTLYTINYHHHHHPLTGDRCIAQVSESGQQGFRRFPSNFETVMLLVDYRIQELPTAFMINEAQPGATLFNALTERKPSEPSDDLWRVAPRAGNGSQDIFNFLTSDSEMIDDR